MTVTADARGEIVLPPLWESELQRFELALRRRGLAGATRRAYANDLRQLAAWAAERDLTVQTLDLKTLRRYVQLLSADGLAA
ncbi:MAG: site-specific integrase, partial [Solirubrobacterales bacterium]